MHVLALIHLEGKSVQRRMPQQPWQKLVLRLTGRTGVNQDCMRIGPAVQTAYKPLTKEPQIEAQCQINCLRRLRQATIANPAIIASVIDDGSGIFTTLSMPNS